MTARACRGWKSCSRWCETMAPEPFARKLVEAVRAAGVAQRTTILSFDWRALQAVQKMAPEIGTVYLSIRQRNFDNIGAGRAEGSAWTAGIQHADHGSVPKMIKAAGGRIWSSFHGDLDAAQVKEAKSLGLTVLAWTVNDPARMAQVMDMGVDGIVTDRPDLLRLEMQRRGLPLPPPSPVTPAPRPAAAAAVAGDPLRRGFMALRLDLQALHLQGSADPAVADARRWFARKRAGDECRLSGSPDS